jgi:Saxitoxin biosynthesis operon protein SxtJ
MILAEFRSFLAESETSNRSFGLLLSAVFFLLGFMRIWRGGPIRWWAVILAAGLLALSLIAPALLRKPRIAWLFLGFLLGRVVNPIVIGLIFFLIITPGALVMRLLGRDPLSLRRDPRASSYWRTRSEAAGDMNLQF